MEDLNKFIILVVGMLCALLLLFEGGCSSDSGDADTESQRQPPVELTEAHQSVPDITSMVVTLQWDASTEYENGSVLDVGGYRVYFGTKSRYDRNMLGYDSEIDVGDVTFIEIINLDSNVEYYFSVTAYAASDISNESEFSDEISFITE